MQLTVRHTTHYRYQVPASYAVQRLMLTPLDFASQKVRSWTIEAPGIAKALSYRDAFGNIVHVVTSSGRMEEVTVVASGVVETSDGAGVVRGLASPMPEAVYLRQTIATRPSPEIKDIAAAARATGGDTIAQMHALMEAIRARISFEIGATTAHTTAAESLQEGRGVCQDHAHVFLAAARHLGLPARYVTGYIVTGSDHSATASHAWAEVLIPSLGWTGFDAANRVCPTDEYVRVAAGLDAAGVVPVLGSRRGGAIETMAVQVNVTAQ
jgi:transglutaminase-like putative cysteine protease